MTIFNFIALFGGLALFLYGMEVMGDGLKNSSGAALKKVLEKVTNNLIMSSQELLHIIKYIKLE